MNLHFMGHIPSAASGGARPGSARSPGAKRIVKETEPFDYLELGNRYEENYRHICTNILLATPGRPPRVLAVTSAAPGEGKTATVVNLARSFSNPGKKVLIIDGALRKPMLHDIFRTGNTPGLSSLQAGASTLDDVIVKTRIKNLSIIPSGAVPLNSADLLDAKGMKNLLQDLKKSYDFILIDCPIVGSVESVIISHYADGALLVAWGGKTHRKLVEKARDKLVKYGDINLLGVALNKVDMKKSGYGYYLYGH